MLLGRVKRILKSEGYKVFEEPYKINIVGVRSNVMKPESFDDEFYCFWHQENGKLEGGVWNGTTDPGTFWLNNPSLAAGTAILKEGQYEDCYQIGWHKGDPARPALIQVRPVTVYRDYDRDAILDYKNGYQQTGMFGINIHAPTGQGDKKYIEKDSAGCQVAENNQSHLFLMAAAEKHRSYYGNRFTYTLIDFRAQRRNLYKKVGLFAGIASLAAGVIFFKGNKINNL